MTRRRLTYMSIWAVVFTGMSVAGVVDDKHPGQWLPFWQKACAQNAPHGCENLSFLENDFCRKGSGWACNEIAVLQAHDGVDPEIVASTLQRSCQLGTLSACKNLALQMSGSTLQNEPPRLKDYPIILRGSKGPITEGDPAALYALACEQSWPDTCGVHSSINHQP